MRGVPATVANDAICAALGAYRWGRGGARGGGAWQQACARGVQRRRPGSRAAIVSAAALVDLDTVVVAGGVATAGDLILRPTLRHCAAYAGLAFIGRLRISAGGLTQPVAGLLGAAAMPAEV